MSTRRVRRRAAPARPAVPAQLVGRDRARARRRRRRRRAVRAALRAALARPHRRRARSPAPARVPARHRLPRPRRAQPACCTAAARCSALGGSRRSLAYLVGATDRPASAAYSRGARRPVLMRAVDVLLAFPPLLFLLVLRGRRRRRRSCVLVIGIAVDPGPRHRAHHPRGDARGVGRGLVEAAVARGERTRCDPAPRDPAEHLGRRSLADVGLRFTVLDPARSRALNFLGLGVQPPAADWALMITENRDGHHAQPLGRGRAGGADRAADDRGQPDRRRRSRAASARSSRAER